jgi:hypothetical protein
MSLICNPITTVMAADRGGDDAAKGSAEQGFSRKSLETCGAEFTIQRSQQQAQGFDPARLGGNWPST